MKSIQLKILLGMILTVTVSLFFVGSISIYLNYTTTEEVIEQSMIETADIAAQRVSQELNSYLYIAMDTGRIARLTDSEKSLEQKQEIINQAVEAYQLEQGNMIDTNGIGIFDGENYSNNKYFQAAMTGQAYISEPITNQKTGKLSVTVAAPIWKDGVPNTQVMGVVSFIPKETFLNDIVSSIRLSQHTQAFILDKDGTVIADIDINKVKNHENRIQLAKTNSEYSSIAAIEEKMIQGNIGFSRYKDSEGKKFLSYAPIAVSNNWSLGICLPENDYMASTIYGAIIIIILLLLACSICVAVAMIISRKIGKPIKDCAQRITLLADGDLKTPIPQINSHDETKILASATEKIVNNVTGIVEDMSWGLEALANGDFTVDSGAKQLYIGDFIPMAQGMYHIISRLKELLSMIDDSSDKIAKDSFLMAEGANQLSQGSSEQASTIEELAAEINEISVQIKTNAKNTKNASQSANFVGKKMEQSDNKMQQMMQAIEEISDSSQQISKIIKTIEDIAFQTNILALNAAVEASRAGVAGKGFAVVADEVRSLANKSAQASKSTDTLIKNSLKAVENGIQIANETASYLQEAVNDVQVVVNSIDKISDASSKQAETITQIAKGVEQISEIVQTNSATAQESAATSNELSKQAQLLKELVSKFKLNK